MRYNFVHLLLFVIGLVVVVLWLTHQIGDTRAGIAALFLIFLSLLEWPWSAAT